MSMPEPPEEMGSSFLQTDHLEAWEKDREACFAEGKAERLPPWPPKDGEVFLRHRYKDYSYQVRFDLDAFHWEEISLPFEENNRLCVWRKVISISAQNKLTAAYFRGELEEVK